MKRFLLGTLILVLVSITYAQIEIVREGGVGFHCVDGNDEIISSHAQEYKAIEACQNALLADPDGEYSVISTGRLRLSFNEAHALTVKIFPDETGERNSDNPNGTTPATSDCLTAHTCASLGTVTTNNYDAPAGAASDSMQWSTDVTDGYGWIYKTLSSEDDIHISYCADAAPSNGADFAQTTAIIIADGIVWRTDAPVYKTTLPQVGTVRVRTEDAAGTATFSGLGTQVTVANSASCMAIEYEAATDELCRYESSDTGTTWYGAPASDPCQTITALGSGTGYGIASNNGANGVEYTAVVDDIVINNTLSITDSGTPPGDPGTPGGAFSRSNVTNFTGGPDFLIGTGQMSGIPGAWSTWETWMGTQTDVYVCWHSDNWATWADVQTPNTSYHCNQSIQNMPDDAFIVFSLPIVPQTISNASCNNSSLWGDINTGTYDSQVTTQANNLKALLDANGKSNYKRIAIRYGWEMNGNWYPWAICGQSTNFKLGWGRLVDIWRSTMTGIVIDFSPARNSKNLGACDLDCFTPDPEDYDVISRSIHDGWYGGAYGTVVDQDSWEGIHKSIVSDDSVSLDELEAQANTDDRWIAFSEWATQFTDCNDSNFKTAEDQELFIDLSSNWLLDRKDQVAWAAYFSPSCTALQTRTGTAGAIKFKACMDDGTC